MTTLKRVAPAVSCMLLLSFSAAALAGCCSGNGNNAISPTSQITRPLVRRVKVGDISMAYRVYGSGYPLLMLAGSSSTQDDWDPNVISELASKYKVITLDYRGMGLSTSGTKAFTVSRFAADTAGFMDALGISKTNVLGWSMGTNVGQELSLTYPGKVDGLVLYAADCGGPQYVQPSREVAQKLADTSGGLLEQAQRLLPLLFTPTWWSDRKNVAYVMNALGSSTEPMPAESAAKQDRAMIEWNGTYDRLPSIKSPTLLITGDEDVITPPQNSRVLNGRIPDARLVVMHGGGHGVQYQFPAAFAGAVLDFLSNK